MGRALKRVVYDESAIAKRVKELGGQITMSFDTVTPVLQHIKSGKLRALAVTTAKRSSALPDVPTLAESGTPGADAETWWGIAGPAGMPVDVVNALNAEINKALTSPELGTFLTNEGAEAEPMTPRQFGDMMRLETARWTKVAHEANVSID